MKNSYASETPVTDGERVYVYLSYVGLFAYDLQGTLVWSRPMDAKNTGTAGYFYGGAASPALHGGRTLHRERQRRAVVHCGLRRQGPAPSSGVRRAKRSPTGRRPTCGRTIGGPRSSRWARTRYGLYGVDGTLLWELTVGTTLHAPTPFAQGGILYVSSGYFSDPKRPVFAIRPGASGDISLKAEETAGPFIAWSLNAASATYPSALVVGDQFYTLLDRGFLTAHDARTGKEIYGRQRIAADAGTFSASPWAYNGRLFVLSEDGDTFVIQAGPEYKLLAKNSLNEMALASPAVSAGRLFIRTATKLYCIARPRP